MPAEDSPDVNEFGYVGFGMLMASIGLAIARAVGSVGAWIDPFVSISAVIGLIVVGTIGVTDASDPRFLPQWAGYVGVVSASAGIATFVVGPITPIPYGRFLVASAVLFGYGMVIFVAAEEAHEQLTRRRVVVDQGLEPDSNSDP